MTARNVELARRAYDAFNRRDWEAFASVMDPGVATHSRLVAVEGGYDGLDGLRRWWDDFLDAFPDYSLHVEEMSDLGDVTVARAIAIGHGATSAAPVVDPIWHVIHWRDGLVVSWRVCTSEAEALEVAGTAGR